MSGLQKLRRVAVGMALAMTAAGVLPLYLWNAAGAKGFLLGALAGILPFWLFGREAEKRLAQGREVDMVSARWALVRMGLSIAALLGAWQLAPGELAGVLCALAGLFVMRAVLLALALTGLDLKLGR